MNRQTRRILACFLAAAMLMSMGAAALAADAEAPAETAYIADISPYRGEVYTAPEQEGSVFAGWYADAAFTQPLDASVTEGGAYAKFVDAHVLSVKWQVTAGTNAQSERTKLRLLTGVDTLMQALAVVTD